MSRDEDASYATRTALREQAEQITSSAMDRVDRLLSGLSDEDYERYLREVREARELDHRIQMEQYRAAVAISRRNRGEEP